MAKVPNAPKGDQRDPEDRPVRILVAYDCFESGLQAMQLYRHLSETFDQDYRFEINFWRFEILGVPSISERSAAEAVGADLVVVATDGKLGIPNEFLGWIEKWIEQKVDQDSALVHVSSPANAREEDTEPVRQFLRQIAARGRMTFIAKPFQGGAQSRDSLGEPDSHQRFLKPFRRRDSSGPLESVFNSQSHEQKQTHPFVRSARPDTAKAESQ